MTQADILVRLEQRSEGPLHVNRGKVFSYRYAYARSADSQRDDEPGQDYLVFRDLEYRFVFAVCDGVSQSFFGDLAARFLGDALTNWLTQDIPAGMDVAAIQVAINAHLSDLTEPATQRIEDHPIPSEPALLHEVLLDKKSRGSETMFACGCIDAPSSEFPAGRVVLTWMGDMRLYLWRASGRVDLGGSHETGHRWSTKRGPVGGPINVYVAPLVSNRDPITRLVVYSDGLSELDSQLDRDISNQVLQQIIWDTKSQPDSDDITYFELYPTAAPKPAQAAAAQISTPALPVPQVSSPQPMRSAATSTPEVKTLSVPTSTVQPAIQSATVPTHERRSVWPWALAGGILLGLLGSLLWVRAGIFPFSSPPSPTAPIPALASVEPAAAVPTPFITPTAAETVVAAIPATTSVPQPTPPLDEGPTAEATAAVISPTQEISVPTQEPPSNQEALEETAGLDGSGSSLSGPAGGALEQALSGAYSGSNVTVEGSFSQADLIRFAWSVAAFEEETGIEVNFLDSDAFPNSIDERVAGANAPDVADFSELGSLAPLVNQGLVIDPTSFIPPEWLEQQYSPLWTQMPAAAGPDGLQTAGVWHRVNGKSLVWYPKTAFEALEYTVPQTWEDLLSLTQEIAANGQTPWCVVDEDDAIGRQATDWTEELMLRTTSPENYDAWAQGELPFSSPEVQKAVTQWSASWPAPGYLSGDQEATSPNYSPPASMFDGPPGCWLFYRGDFSSDLLPDGKQAGVDYDFFYLPPLSGSEDRPFLVDGHIMAMFDDRPEVRALMEYFTLPESMEGWLATGGALAPHKAISPDEYTLEDERLTAQLLAQATTIHSDGSKLMPPEVGSGSFPEGMARYVRKQVDLTTVLGEIDNSWPGSEQGSTQ